MLSRGPEWPDSEGNLSAHAIAASQRDVLGAIADARRHLQPSLFAAADQIVT